MTLAQVIYWGVTLGWLIAMPIALLFGVWALAGLDIFFTFLAEGTGMAVMAGGKLVPKDGGVILEGGKLHRIAIAYDDHTLQYDPVLHADEVVKGREELSWSILHLLQRLGIYWIGIAPFFNRLRYMFWWTEEVKRHQDVGGSEIRERNEVTKFFYVAVVPYKIRIIGVEIAGNVLVDYEFTAFYQIILPEIALFRTKDWFRQAVAFAKGATVTYGRDKEFGTLNTATDKAAYAKHQLDTNPSLRGQLGVRLVGIEEVEVALTGGASDRINAAVTAQKVAEFEGEAEIMKATKEKEAIRIRADAEKDRIEKVYGAIATQPEGVKLRQYEAFERVKGTVIFTDNKTLDAGDKALVAIERQNRQEGEE